MTNSAFREGPLTRILYLNVHDLSYPRNARIRAFFESRGIGYTVVPRRETRSFIATSWRLLRAGVSARGPFDVVILAELGVQFAPVGRIVAWRHRARLVVDAFVGMYESNVLDWHRVSGTSVKGRIYRMFDIVASRFSYGVLVDTDVRVERVVQDGAHRVVSLPVGAPEWATSEHPVPTSERTRVLYYGNYIPLHGLDYVIRAIAGIDNLDNFEFTFIGDGEGRPPIEELASQLGVAAHINFLPPVPESTLGDHIWASHLVLGVFGTSTKAATVLANKVWQGLACGRAVVTRSSPALAELNDITHPDQLLVVDSTDPSNLTSTLNDVDRLRLKGLSLSFPDSSERLEKYVDDRYLQLLDLLPTSPRG